MQGDTVLMYDNTEINHLIDTSSEIEDSIDFIIHRIDSSRSVKLDSLFSDYNNLSYNNSYDSLYKELYYVLLKRLNNDTLTTTEYDFLYDLSRECPDEYGVITNKANAILNLEDHLEDLLDNCPSPIVLKSSNLENGHTPILYPNPVSNELTIITEHSIDKCYISDIYGKNIMSIEDLQTENNKTHIKISELNLTAGAYFLNIAFLNRMEVKKLIIKN